MSRVKLVIATLALMLAVSAPAHAATITFGVSSLDNLASAGAQVEAGFTYSATGAAWELQTIFSNPGAAATTWFNGQLPNAGDFMTFSQIGGGLFTFDSIQWATVESTLGANDVIIEGFLGAALVGSVAITGSSATFQTQTGFAGPIDSLRIRVTSQALENAMQFDNLVLTPTAVPEPGTLLLLGAGIAALVARRRLSART